MRPAAGLCYHPVMLRTITPWAITTALLLSLSLAVACGSDADGADDAAPPQDAVALDTAEPPDAGPLDAIEPDAAEPTDAPEPLDAAPDAADPLDAAPADTRPPLDPLGDADKDGVLDLDEVADGTDPYDPRSARAWHPEITGHPRLFMGPDDLDRLAALAAEPTGAHATLWTRVVNRSQQNPAAQPTDGTYDPSAAAAQGEVAEAAAFRGLLEADAAMTAKALDLLSAPIPDPTYLNTGSSFNVGAHYNLIESDALVGFCTAYDYVAGTPGVDAEALATARARLVERIDHFRTLCFEGGGCRNLIRNERNNHTMKPMGALGLCAIAVPDRATAAADFNEAVASLDWLFNHRQGVPEGGYGENWNYLNYGAQSFIQLMVAWHRLAPGETWPLRGLGLVTPDDPRAGLLTDYLDFAAHPTTRAVFLAMMQATRPDGLTVPIDDGNPSAASAGLLAAFFDDPRFLWLWEKPRVNRAASRCVTATFALLDPAMAPVDPDWPLSLFLPEAGFTVLRTGFDPDQLYIHFNHEHGPVRQAGYSHEHADSLSVVLHAFGEPLIIDPGYINYGEHLRVKYGHDHNLVLVDGEGPPFFFLDPLVQAEPEGDAWLHTWDDDPDFTTAIASTKYGEAELRRRIVRVRERYLVIADDLLSATDRVWTWQINGLAGGTVANTSFEQTPLGGRWTRPKARAVVAVASTVGAATFDTTLEDHLNDGGWKEHVRLAAEATMGPGAGFVAVVLPDLADAPEATFTALDPADGVAALVVTHADGAVDLVALNLTDAAHTVDASGLATPLPAGALTLRRLAPAAEAARTWPMATPPIPDPPPTVPTDP